MRRLWTVAVDGPPKVDQSEPSAKWGWLFLIIPVSVIVGVAFVASRRRQDSA